MAVKEYGTNSMKEAPSFKGAFLVSATPPSGRHRGSVLVTVGVWLAGQLAVLTLDHKNSYLAVKNFSDSLGAGWRESEYADRQSTAPERG